MPPPRKWLTAPTPKRGLALQPLTGKQPEDSFSWEDMKDRNIKSITGAGS